MSSRWAVNAGDDAQALGERKRRKEEKRRLKESREVQQDTDFTSVQAEDLSDVQLSGRPAKRRRTTSPLEETGETSRLLEFPTLAFQSSGRLDQYKVLNSIEEGSYGYVSRAQTKVSGDIVALKRLKIEQNSDGFPVTGLREIETLRACSHLHIVKLREVITSDNPTQE